MMRAALYTRVSTLEQAAEGYSIGVQKDKLSQYAAAYSHSVYKIYSDEGFSGKTLFRPALEEMITDIQTGKIDIVLIYKLDRLSRRVKDVLELVELFEKYNVTLYSLNENLDLSSPFGRAALKMSATFSELERETIVERMTMGKNARAKSGKYSIPGIPPFGYRNGGNDNLVVYEPEAEAIRKMFDLYINQGYTMRKLYDYCREAYPDIKYFNNQMCCKPILKRALYSGYYFYKQELIKGTNFEPIISYETYLQAQACIEKNKTKRNSDSTPYLLTGLILCAKCGNRYVGKLYDRYSYKNDGTQTKRYKYRSYGCAARVKRDKNYHPFLCDNPIINSSELEEKIEKFIKQIDFQELKKSVNYVPGFIEKLLAENASLKDRKEKLLDLYLDNAIDKDSYTLRLVEIESKLNENKLLIENETLKVQDSPPGAVDVIRSQVASYDTLTKNEKRRLLSHLIKSIVIDGENISVNLNLSK